MPSSFGVLLHEVVSGQRPHARHPMEPLRCAARSLRCCQGTRHDMLLIVQKFKVSLIYTAVCPWHFPVEHIIKQESRLPQEACGGRCIVHHAISAL